MRTVKRINPIYLLIALNILFIVVRNLVLSEDASVAIGSAIESSVLSLGVFGYAGIVVAYGLCAFFFVPLLIPLNILGGALYGAYVGTVVALAGIVLGCVASTVSVRYVFTGMQRSLDDHPRLKTLIGQADRHRNLVIVIMRFTVVIPYLVQNIALAATSSSIVRITLITAFSAIPGAAIYSFLGAGLVHAEQVNELLFYLALPAGLLVVVFGGLAYMRKRYEQP
jgi:uncharacterized membrane protein YdjX (TVP38/TMEM64 family)